MWYHISWDFIDSFKWYCLLSKNIILSKIMSGTNFANNFQLIIQIGQNKVLCCNPISDHMKVWLPKWVSRACISNYIPQYTVGCNYLYMPLIPASGNKVLILSLVIFMNATEVLLSWLVQKFVEKISVKSEWHQYKKILILTNQGRSQSLGTLVTRVVHPYFVSD